MKKRLLPLVLLVSLLALAVEAIPSVTNIEHLAPAIVNNSQTNITLMTFTLTTIENFPAGRWSGSGAFRATTYTGAPGDISKVSLYADDGNNMFSSNDTLCGSATTAYNNQFSFKPGVDCNLDTNVSKKFFVVIDIASSAQTGNAVDLRIDAYNLSFMSGLAPTSAINPAGQAYVNAIIPDTTNPVTTHNIPTAWQNALFTVQLVCTDSQSGCGSLNALVNGTLSSTAENTLNVQISTEGIHTIEFWSVDNTGNEEAHQTKNLSVDLTRPALINFTTNTSLANQNDVLQITITFSDTLSGIEHGVSPVISWENLPAMCDGTFTQTNYSGNVWRGTTVVPANCDGTATIVVADTQDIAGNRITETNGGSFTIDNTAPATPSLVIPLNNALLNNDSLTNSSVNFSWSVSNISDVDQFAVQIATNSNFSSIISEVNTTATSVLRNLSEDVYYWRVISYDAVGNAANSSSNMFELSSRFIEIFTVNVTAGGVTTPVTAGLSLVINTTQNSTLFIAVTESEAGLPNGFTDRVGSEYELSITDFDNVSWPVELNIYYNDSVIAGLDESSLRIGWFLNNWSVFPANTSGVNLSENFAWTDTNTFIHISLFANEIPAPFQPSTSLTKRGPRSSDNGRSSSAKSSTASTSQGETTSSEQSTAQATQIDEPVKEALTPILERKEAKQREDAPVELEPESSSTGLITTGIIAAALIALAGYGLSRRKKGKGELETSLHNVRKGM